MILRPEQVRLIAQGLPTTPANRASRSESNSSTANQYSDKRNAVQGGVGISGDGNTAVTNITTLDGGAVRAGIAGAVMGTVNALGGMAGVASNALGGMGGVASNALGGMAGVAGNALGGMAGVSANANATMADVSKSVVNASSHLADVGLSMLQTNTALTNSLEGGINQSQQALSQIAAGMAQTQVAAQNDNRYLIAAGMAVVAIVGFAAFGKGKA